MEAKVASKTNGYCTEKERTRTWKWMTEPVSEGVREKERLAKVGRFATSQRHREKSPPRASSWLRSAAFQIA